MAERIVRGMAGTLVILSAILAFKVNINWIWLAVFVGANLIIAALTGSCFMVGLLNKMGVASSGSCCVPKK